MPTSPSALLTAIIESSDDAIVSKNLDGTITSWNRSAERIFGFTSQEAVGKSITIIIPPDRLAEEDTILRKLRAGERIDHFETLRQRKDGTLLDISVTISPIRDSGTGEIVGASKVARDISARKQYDALIARKSEKLRILNELASSIVGELELERLVQAATDAGRELTGAAFGAFFYNVQNEQGEAYLLFTLSGAPREAFEKFGMPRNTAVFAPTFSGEGVVRVPDILKDPRYGKMSPHHGMPPGHLPVRSYLAVPVFARSGEVIGGLFYGHPEPDRFQEESEEALVAIAGLAGTAIDNARLHTALQRELAQQKALQQALRESESLSRGILDSTADCVMLLDRSGRIQRVNGPGLRLLGKNESTEITGSNWRDLWPSALRNTVESAVAEALTGKVVRFQGATVPGNVVRWYDVMIAPLPGDGPNTERLTATLRDITDFRRAENDARAAADEALRQSRIKDDFLATLSHELRTPLQSILGWIQILRMDAGDPAELAEGLEVIERSTLAQSRIVEDLLDMNRILSGKVRLDVQTVSLASVLEAAVETIKPAANAKGVRVQSILDPSAKPVSGDPNRLQQIFWNLLTNAVKFTPRDGSIRVVLERVNSHLEVTVADTGAGISPEFLPYVFDRFRQADSSTTRRHGGLGLGLAIVKHLTELHGGSVRVKSGGEGQGATFTVHLPLAPVNEEGLETRHHPEISAAFQPLQELPRLDGARVIVVDDEADSRSLIGRILEKAGAEVMLAESGNGCLEALKRSVPDVIVSDIGMPALDGYSLIRSIRKLPPSEGGRVPAIALTAYTRSEDRVRAIAEGFQLHLSKPANALELLTFVESLWNRKAEK
jgi:PAS domain S-box-containing protein